MVPVDTVLHITKYDAFLYGPPSPCSDFDQLQWMVYNLALVIQCLSFVCHINCLHQILTSSFEINCLHHYCLRQWLLYCSLVNEIILNSNWVMSLVEKECMPVTCMWVMGFQIFYMHDCMICACNMNVVLKITCM